MNKKIKKVLIVKLNFFQNEIFQKLMKERNFGILIIPDREDPKITQIYFTDPAEGASICLEHCWTFFPMPQVSMLSFAQTGLNVNKVYELLGVKEENKEF